MVRLLGRPHGQFPGSREREYIFMDKNFKSATELATYIARQMGIRPSRTSWQVLIFTRRFALRYRGKIAFVRPYTDQDNYRIVEGAL
jgi:hypothetical protein